MALTPETLAGHELVGLDVRVARAANADAVGIAGRVVRETAGTLDIGGSDGVRRIPKAGATFEFDLPAGDTVRVAGSRLAARPVRRTERTGGSRWH